MSVNLNSIENNTGEDRLVAFKKCMAELFCVLREGLDKFFPDSSAQEKELFLYGHFCFVYGLYPITHPTPKQVSAMEKADFKRPQSFETLCYEELVRLAGRL